MPDLTVNSVVDTFMQASSQSGMRQAIGVNDGSSAELDRVLAHHCRFSYFWSTANTTSTVSGTGSVNRNDFAGDVQTGTTSSSRAQLTFPVIIGSTFFAQGNGGVACDFSKRFTVSFALNWVSSSTNGKFFLRIGQNSSTTGDLSGAGIGIYIANTSLIACAHNGSALTTSSSLATLSGSNVQFVTLQSDGAGSVAVYLNESLATTLSGGPTSIISNWGIGLEALNGSDSSNSRLQISPINIIRAI